MADDTTESAHDTHDQVVEVHPDQLVLDGMPEPPPPAPPAPGPVTLRSMWRTPLRMPKPRTVAAATLVGMLLLGTAGGAYRLGTDHAALGPTVFKAPAAGVPATQQVYQLAGKSVVTLQMADGGSGSGFFIRPGRILTNFHVIATSTKASVALLSGQSTNVTVILADGRQRTGTVKLFDQRLDLAIVDVDPNLGVPPLAFADLHAVEPGQPVAVIGAPFGLSASVTEGILSGVARGTTFAENPVQSQLLQTDAAVNPGNSGGPLLDTSGRVLGMVTLRPDTADGRQVSNIAFALPADALIAAVNQLDKYGNVSHPVLGVQLRDATGDDHASGVVIESVTTGSAAAAAHLRKGDVITALGGQHITGYTDVVRVVTTHRAGDQVGVTALRDGHTVTTSLTLQERPAK